jgi:hypothetical protein
MHPILEGLSVRAFKIGKAGHILFEPLDSWARSLADQLVQVQIEYRYGHALLVMGDRYSMQMVAGEFWALAQNDWGYFPKESFERLTDGTIKHETTSDAAKFHASATDIVSQPPAKTQKDAGWRTDINYDQDRARLLQYWASAQWNISVRVAVSVNSLTAEYWFNMVLEPVPDDEDGKVYAEILRHM